MDSFINKLKLKSQEYFAKYKVADYLSFLRKSQYFSNDKILEIQCNKLRNLLNYSSQNIKFYNILFKKTNIKLSDIKSPEDLTKLPVMTKDSYRNDFPNNFVNLKASKQDLFLNFTSGSTGNPFKFYMTQKHRGHKIARLLRSYEWAGRKYGELMVKIWGALHLTLKKKISHKFIENLILFDAFDLNNDNFLNFYKKIVKKNVKLLEAYTSSAYNFALLLEENNLFLNIPSIVVSGETLHEFQIEKIKERFNSDIYNRYGSREFGNFAQDCSEHKGLHICQEDFIIEIVDNDNEPVEIGKTGKILITCLDNLTMPFIRYQIDDIGALSPEFCSCGRNLKLLKFVEGRMSDMIYSPSGKHISLYFFALLFQDLSDYVKEFQVVQKKNKNELILTIIPTTKFTDKIKATLIDQVKKLDNLFEVTIEKIKEIPLEPSGKKKYLKIA